MNKPIAIVSEGLDPAPLAFLKDHCEVVEAAQGTPAFDEALPRAAALVVRTYTKVNAGLLDRAPKLRVVGRGGVGLENIDVGACRSRGVEVVYTPDANTTAVGDFVFGLMIQLVRPFAAFHKTAYEPAEFKRIRNTQRGRQLNELTLGILGMGRVGRTVGRIGSRGFGMRVIYNDITDVSAHIDFPAASVSLDELLRDADVLTLHIDARPGNHRFIDAGKLSRLKRDAVLINTSRGEVLDAAALAAAIRKGELAGAALDVYDPEPPAKDFPLLGLTNVILTPHMAARTSTAIEAMSWVVRDVVGVLSGESARFPAP